MSVPAPAAHPEPQKLTVTHWLVMIVASIGFLFDTYELLMTPLVLAPALSELLRLPPNHPEVTAWAGRVLWMTALCGGVFGLLGGWLIDRLGRKSVMIGSIFVYSFSPVMAGLSTSLFWLILFRCTTFVGVCVEFVAAVTWLSELFPDKKQRELVLGWTQAFASIGGLFVTGVSVGIRHLVTSGALPNLVEGGDSSWRWTLMTGLIPALPIAILLPFVPESAAWLERKRAGTLRRPRFSELFAPALLRTTLVGTILSACAYAAAFGTLQVTVLQGVPGLPLPDLADARKHMQPLIKENGQIQTKLNDMSKDSPEREKLEKRFNANLEEMGKINREEIQPRRHEVQFMQELGGLVGRILLAIVLVLVVSKRLQLWLFQVPGLVIIPVVWFWVFANEPQYFTVGAFLAGACIVAQFSYLGEYLPKVFPVHLRGTGGAFATNVGGRMIGTCAAFLTTGVIAPLMTMGSNNFENVAYAAGITGTLVFLLGFVASFFLPDEPEEEKA